MADGTQKIEISLPALAGAVQDDKECAAMAAKAAKKAKLRKFLLFNLATSVIGTSISAGWWFYNESQHYVTTENAYVGAETAQITSQIEGGIAKVHVSDTQAVHAGDVLVSIDTRDAQLAVLRAEADYQRTLQRVQQYYAQESAAKARVDARAVEAERAGLDFQRRERLAAAGAVSAEEFSSSRSAFAQAKANLAASQEELAAHRSLTKGLDASQHPETLAAKAVLDAAVLDLDRASIRAPIDGVVAQVHAQVGQRIQPGQSLMVVSPISEAYVDANFKEGQLRNVRVGQPVELTSDLYGHDIKYSGRVEGVGGGTGSAFSIIPAQNATGNWIKVVQRVPVRISLDPDELAANPLRVGLSMEAKIDISKD